MLARSSVPATLQATIAARIDRLDPLAKRTLERSGGHWLRFSLDLLAGLGIDPCPRGSDGGELIDQVRFTRHPSMCSTIR